jgi:hypothetical protein
MRGSSVTIVTCGILLAASLAEAQRPAGDQAPQRRAGGDDLVDRMMTFDKDKDGKLTKAEVTDERLHRLFDRADANKDGTVTKEELTSLASQDASNDRGGPPGFGPPGGGPGGPMMAPPRPGEILPQMFQQRLRLTPEQKTQVDELQKDVDARLARILTDEQKTQLKEMRQRGPGGFGPPPGGGPPGGRRPGGPVAP